MKCCCMKERYEADAMNEITRHQDATIDRELGPWPSVRVHYRDHRPHTTGAVEENHGRGEIPCRCPDEA